jgi:subtilisin family serine protease
MADDVAGRISVPAGMAEAEPTGPVARADRPPDLVFDSVVSEPLRAVMRAQETGRIGVLVEMRPAEGLEHARTRLASLLADVTAGRESVDVHRRSPYATVSLDAAEIAALVERDSRRPTVEAEPAKSASNPAPRGCIYRLWPNFEITGLIIRSAEATKCRAAQRTFEARGKGIVWAVLDSGIARHVHFETHQNLALPEGLAHRSFLDEDSDPLVDDNGHGTHVAGIIAGGLPRDAEETAVGWYRDAEGNERRQALSVKGIAGMAPETTLLSCKVLRGDRTGDVTALLEALLYIQEVNDHGRNLRVHGVNISVGHVFDPRWFAAGRTPICLEVDRLVKTGVVVVVAAGNTGYGYAKDPNGQTIRLGFDMTINDPGNAALGITVGATSSAPHTTGVSYFSSKGPTGDGRLKPDIVAPGERVISAAAGKLREQAQLADPKAQYIESSGTSMAAPHVSGAVAGLLSVKPEFLGQPERVKEVLMGAATDLGRARTFQGAGMLDALRAVQSL